MDQHPIPRQITSFEFKLIGFMTLKQFIYSVVVVLITIFVYFIIPIPFINMLVTLVIGCLGGVFVFFKYNDRPLDVLVKNFFIHLIKPPQYYYIKKNSPPSYLKDVFVPLDNNLMEMHIDASRKLGAYLSKTNPPQTNTKKQGINNLLDTLHIKPGSPDDKNSLATKKEEHEDKKPNDRSTPFLSGVIKNSKSIPLEGIMIYIKDLSNKPVRILKTNHNGVFASFHPLPTGRYLLEPKDLRSKYFFDTMDVIVDKPSHDPISLFSRELL